MHLNICICMARERERKEEYSNERETNRMKKKLTKSSGNDSVHHYTILPARSIQWNFLYHVKCLHLRSTAASLCVSRPLCLIRCFTWLHIRFYFLFIFSHVCIDIPCFFRFSFFLINFTQVRRLSCLLLQHEYDAIFIPYVFAHLYEIIQRIFFTFLEKKPTPWKNN